MQFAKLPDSVVYLIIRYSLSLNTRTPVRFKENVGLLAVCHKLRILGLPLVYDAVFIYPTMFGAYTSYADQIKNAQSLMGPGIDTNLDLIHEGGLSSVVNTFMVELHFDTQPFSNLRHILGTLSRVNNRWSSVEKLHFVFRPDLFAMDGQNVNLAHHEGNIITTCSMLVKTMPRVTMLEFREPTHNILVRELCGRITTVFASKLVRLSSRAQLYMHQGCELVGLKQLSLDWNNDINGHCPRVSPGSLVSLRLTTGSGYQIWQPFAAANSTKIVFPCLQFLQVIFSSWQGNGLEHNSLLPNKRGQKYVLRFPSLKTLYVNDKHCTKKFLSSVVLPTYMDSITIHASATGIRDIGHVLPKARSMSLVIDSYASDTHTLELANKVLSTAKESKQLQLRIFNSELPVSAKTISCTNLTHLYVAAPICVNTTIELVLKLRSLCELGIQSLKLGDFNHDPIPEPNSHTRVTPFNTRLKSLELHFNEHEFSAYAVVQVVKMLLLKMPTLERVVSPKVPKKSILDFIGEYKEEYPHLKYLDFMWHTLPEIEGY